MKKILISGGWAHPPEFYNKYFSKENFELYYLREEISNKKFDVVICWSMGTLKYFQRYTKINSEKIILISPTFNFMKKREEGMLNQMITGIKTNKEKIIRNFYLSCFFNKTKGRIFYKENKDFLLKQEKNILLDGLDFLKNYKTHFFKQINKEIIIFTGKNDDIIPYVQSKEVIDFFENSVHIEFENCGHNIFEEKKEIFIDKLRGIISDK